MDQPSFEEVLYTTRAMRRMRPDPVPEEDLRFILDAATQAATAHNSQTWGFVVVTDAEQRKRIGEVYQRIAEKSVKPGAEGKTDLPEAEVKVYANAYRFAQRFGEVPALIVCCMRGPRPDDLAWASSYYGSMYPAIQNMMLAARYRGLGTVLTTLHLIEEDAIKRIVGLPANIDTVAIIPIGYPEGKFAKPVRRPSDEVTHWQRWGS